MQSVIIVLVVVLVLEIESVKTATTTTSTSTNRMTNKIGVPQPIFSLKKFLFPIRLAAFQARGGALMSIRNGFFLINSY